MSMRQQQRMGFHSDEGSPRAGKAINDGWFGNSPNNEETTICHFSGVKTKSTQHLLLRDAANELVSPDLKLHGSNIG